MSDANTARLLMCPPDYYAVNYEINPWMSVARPVIHDAAVKQWRQLYAVLSEITGAQVELVRPVAGLPDLVFTANAGLVWDKKVVLSNFRHPERAGEALIFADWFEEKGYEVIKLPLGCSFEGEGDILPMGDLLLGGYRFRSDLCSHDFVGEITGRKVISLELVDPYFYHLDTCFWPITDRLAAYYPDAFSACGKKLLRENVPDLLPISRSEALLFCCNSIRIGDQIALNTGCHELGRELKERGYTINEVELSEFIKAGGSAKCLVLFLTRS